MRFEIPFFSRPLIQIDQRTQFQSYLEHVNGQVNMGGQGPVSSLMISSNYLRKATAETASSLVERKVMAIQRFLKKVVERDLFDVVLRQEGLDAQKASVCLNWGIHEEPEIDFAQMVRLAEISATTGIQYIRPDEMRKFLSKIGVEIWEPEERT